MIFNIISSKLGLHAVAPRAVFGGTNVVVPILTDGTHTADLALNRLVLDKRIDCNNARLPLSLALETLKTRLIQAIIVTLLTVSDW